MEIIDEKFLLKRKDGILMKNIGTKSVLIGYRGINKAFKITSDGIYKTKLDMISKEWLEVDEILFNWEIMKFYKERGNNNNHIIIAKHYFYDIGELVSEYYMVTDNSISKIEEIISLSIYRFYGEFTFKTNRYLGNGLISFGSGNNKDNVLDLNNKKIWKNGILNTKEITIKSNKKHIFMYRRDILIVEDIESGEAVNINDCDCVSGHSIWDLTYFKEVDKITFNSSYYLDGNLYIMSHYGDGYRQTDTSNCRIDLMSGDIILESEEYITIVANRNLN